MANKKKPTYAVVDLEATGSGSDRKIIQIGIVLVRGGEILETFASDINPHQTLDVHVSELTGITDAQLEVAPDFSQVAGRIHDLICDAIFVAHNVRFDANLLAEALFFEGYELRTPRIDTVELAQIFFPTLERYGLSYLSEQFHLGLDQAHTAISDAMATATLFLTIQEKILSLPKTTIEQILDLSDSLIYESRLAIDEVYPQTSDRLGGKWLYRHGLVLKEEKAFPTPRCLSQDVATNLFLLGLEERSEQLDFARMMEKRLADAERVHFIEAQAGIGKTYGYLLPLLSQDKRGVLVSTPTKLLQDQLLNQEGAQLAQTFQISMTSIKSPRHYICLDKFIEFLYGLDDNRLFNICKMQILVWLCETETGDMDELNQQRWQPSYYQALAHDGKENPQSLFGSDDFWNRLGRRAEASQVVVTNHAYLLETIRQKQSLLGNRVLVVDEAHRFLLMAEEHVRASLDVADLLQSLQGKISRAETLLEKRLLESCFFELHHLVETRRFGQVRELDEGQLTQLRQTLSEIELPLLADLQDILRDYDQFWLEEQFLADKRIVFLRACQNDLADVSRLFPQSEIFFISATLAISQQVNLADLLGFSDYSLDLLPKKPCLNQQLLYLSDLPSLLDWSETSHATFLADQLVALSEVGQPILVLFTSLSLLQAVSVALTDKRVEHLSQHKDGSDFQLKKRFEKGETLLLLATVAFFQGVDFAAQKRIIEVITRLPFDNPTDKFTQKIHHYLRQRGKNPFYDYSLPMMLLRLEQAIGRVNRGVDQKSTVLFYDPRLTEKKYSHQIRSFLEKSYLLKKTSLEKVEGEVRVFFKDSEV